MSPLLRTHARSFELLAGATLALVVVLLALGVHLDPLLVRLDEAVVASMHAAGTVHLTELSFVLSDFAGTQAVMLVTPAVALLLILRRHWHGALAVVVSVAAAQVIVQLIKVTVERARPAADDSMVHAAGYSFPSAHSATSVALYGTLAVIAYTSLRGRMRVLATAAAVSLPLVVGITRIYLGAHYPTDVLAGWIVGALIAAVALRLASRLRARLHTA